MNFHPEDGYVVELAAYKGQMLKKALTSFTLRDAYCSFANHRR